MPPLRIALLIEDLDGLLGFERRLFDKIVEDQRFALAGIVRDGRPSKPRRRGAAPGRVNAAAPC